jgi:glycosyltransferase involved in cell wall biosynthesis
VTELRVLHLNTERTWRGGEQQALYLMEGLRARGVAQLLVAQQGGVMAARVREAGLPVRELRMRGEADPFAVWAISACAKELGASVVHAHTSHAHTLGALAATLMRAGPKVVVSRRVDFSIFRRSFLGLNRIKYLHGVDRYVAVSRAIKDVLVKDGIPAERVSVVHSGIDIGRIDAAPSRPEIRAELGARPGDALVANVAHMADHKGQIFLVEAAPLVLAERPQTTIAIVGEGEERERLEARARELGVAERVRFPGFREDVPSILKAIDVFVMPSHMEGLGTSVLDAFAARAPVVGTTAGGMTEMLEDGANGLVCPVRDPPALARAILRLLGDRELARRLAEKARRDVVERFSKEAMVEGTVAVYRELIAG